MTRDRKIGVAMDFSKGSKLALQWAIDNLIEKGDTLFIIHIKRSKGGENRNSLWASSGSPLIPLVEFREKDLLQKYEISSGPEVFDMLDVAYSQKEAKVLVKIYWGDAREKLCGAVGDLKLDSLVMGCRGLGSIQRVLLGSVTNYVMTSATCAVTIVKDPSFHP